MITVGVLVGSTRPGRVGAQVAQWVAQRAEAHGVRVDFVDLEELALPFLDEPVDAYSTDDYQHQHTRDWSRRVSAMDGIVLVTPEYNASFSAPLKNALDYLYAEWRRMPVGLIGYGGTSAGSRAVQALTPVVNALGMVIAGTVHLPFRQRLDEARRLQPTEGDNGQVDGLIADILELAQLLSPAEQAASNVA